jgi:hypothetical protein
MVVACFLIGAFLGLKLDGLAGATVWAAAGAILGVFLGTLIGGYAWVLESPLKGALRGGGLLAVTMGLLLLIGLLSNHGWGGLENALGVALQAAGIGGVLGGLLGALLAWLAGPIFREIVQEADRGEFLTKRWPWW